MAEFVGTYKFESDDGNLNDFLKAAGVKMMIRQVACALKPTIKVSTKEGGIIVIENINTYKNSSIEFKLGEEFDQERIDGVTVKTVITRGATSLVEEQKGEIPVTIFRSFGDDGLTSECRCDGVNYVSYYKKE